MQKLITPRRLQGFNELDPMRQLQFDQMITKIKDVFEHHCFVPLDSPVLELSEILLAKSGGDIDKEIYRFSKGSTDMCMRYDFTVPLARYVAMNQNTLDFPFKRYQIGKNYRGERPQKGRFREFYQCDADVIGSESLPLVYDAECIALYPECFKALGFDIIVEISDRNILNGIIADVKQEEKTNEILTLLDKIDKLGRETIKEELSTLGIPESDCEKLLLVADNKGSIGDLLSKIENLSSNEVFVKGLNNLKEIDAYLNAFGVNQNNYIYNLSIIRGHNYYTGTVFEVFLKGHRDFGALGGGGRYENLAEYYTDRKLPGVGMSIGLSRLFDLFVNNGLLPEPKKSITEVSIIPLGNTLNNCIALATSLRKNDIKSEVACENRSFKSKMKDANKREIPYIIVVGEDEVASGKYSFKNMTTGEQQSLTLEEIINQLKNRY